MSKGIGKPLVVAPSSLPSGAVDRSTRSRSNLASVNPLFIRGSVGPKASDSTASTGTIAPVLHTPPREPKPPSRIWS
jgi:hypothetical protein